MHGVPHPLMAVDHALGRRLLVAQVERVAPVAAPLGAPLPSLARVAALQQELLGPQSLPERGVEAVRLGRRGGESRPQVRGHSVASLPKMDELTGVTIGPDPTRATSASGTCAVDSPQTWRTASMFRPSPCM